MHFLILAPILLFSTAAALFTVTGGSNFVIAALALEGYQRMMGYKAGEGRLSERESSSYYSTKLDKNSDHDLSHSLGRLAAQARDLFAPFVDKKFDFTKTEGELLRSMVRPAILALEQVEAVKLMLEQDPGNEQVLEVLHSSVDNLGMLIGPIIIFLEQFPKKRIKDV